MCKATVQPVGATHKMRKLSFRINPDRSVYIWLGRDWGPSLFDAATVERLGSPVCA